MPPAPVIEISRDNNPFPTTGVSRDANGIPHYDRLPATLLDMLAEQVDSRPNSEAVVELGGDRLTYRQLWDRASRVAGGLRAAGLQPGDRVAVRYPAGINWVLAFWGTVMAGGVAVAVNTRSAQPEVEFVLSDAGARIDLRRRHPAARRPTVRDRRTRARRHGRAVLHLGHHRSPQGGADHPRGVRDQHRERDSVSRDCRRDRR